MARCGIAPFHIRHKIIHLIGSFRKWLLESISVRSRGTNVVLLKGDVLPGYYVTGRPFWGWEVILPLSYIASVKFYTSRLNHLCGWFPSPSWLHTNAVTCSSSSETWRTTPTILDCYPLKDLVSAKLDSRIWVLRLAGSCQSHRPPRLSLGVLG